MKVQKAVRAVVCTGFLLLCCFLSGCSASFCGFRLGTQEELVFTCAKDLEEQQEEEALPEVREDAGGMDGRSGDQETAASGGESDGKVDLNTADMEELMTLKGVGETRAKAIVEYRAQNGSFTRIEDIMQIPGIKEGIFSKIKDQITVH